MEVNSIHSATNDILDNANLPVNVVFPSIDQQLGKKNIAVLNFKYKRKL